MLDGTIRDDGNVHRKRKIACTAPFLPKRDGGVLGNDAALGYAHDANMGCVDALVVAQQL